MEESAFWYARQPYRRVSLHGKKRKMNSLVKTAGAQKYAPAVF